MCPRVLNDLEAIGLVCPSFDSRADLSGGSDPLTSLKPQEDGGLRYVV